MKDLRLARLSTDGQVKDVRADHVERYEWAAQRTEGHVIDAGCNCGYGSAILADAGRSVTGMDLWFLGLQYARKNWDRKAITWVGADFEHGFKFPPADAVVAFEVIEHLSDPRPLLVEARRVSRRLLASVPNESVWPWEPRLEPAHKRHYTWQTLGALLSECGWLSTDWWGQEDGWAPVNPGVHGRTLVVECR